MAITLRTQSSIKLNQNNQEYTMEVGATLVSKRIKQCSRISNIMLRAVTVLTGFTFLGFFILKLDTGVSVEKLHTAQNVLYFALCVLFGTMCWLLLSTVTSSHMADYANEHPDRFTRGPLSVRVNFIGAALLTVASVASFGAVLIVLAVTFTTLYWQFLLIPGVIGLGSLAVFILGLWN